MANKLKVSPRARRNIDSIISYIARDNPVKADEINVKIEKVLRKLTANPMLGRNLETQLGRPTRLRIFVVTPNYLVIYFVRGEMVHISRVVHAKQNWLENL